MMLLDITIPEGIITIIVILIAISLLTLYSNAASLRKQKEEYLNKFTEIQNRLTELLIQQQSDKKDYESNLKEKELLMQKKEAEQKAYYQNWALEEFDKYKQSEIENIKKHYEEQAIQVASNLLQKWKIEKEGEIRQDAINRSYSVNLGKITEHLVPFHQVFLSQFNPKDARFIGSPIDLVVFDGYADKKDNISIYMVEIKTGNSRLSETQKKIKDAVLRSDIKWVEINPDDNKTNSIEIDSNHHNQNRIERKDPKIAVNEAMQRAKKELGINEELFSNTVRNIERFWLRGNTIDQSIELVIGNVKFKNPNHKITLVECLKKAIDPN